MELTRTKHWSRIWSCVQSLMSPGILLGSGLTTYLGKPGFYACATAVLIGAGLVGFQLIDITKCSSPQLSSSLDNDSPIPPAPPPISLSKYKGHPATPMLSGMGPAVGVPVGVVPEPSPGGLYPLRRSISLQQPIYPCCREAGELGAPVPQPAAAGGYGLGMYPPGYSPYCRECVMWGSPVPPPTPWGMYYQPTPQGTMIRSYSLPQTGPALGSQTNLKSTGTQTNPNSPVKVSRGINGQVPYPGSYDRLPTLPGTFVPQDRVISDRDLKASKSGSGSNLHHSALVTRAPPPSSAPFREISSYKNTVMFASNPQLFPASSSATSTTDRSSIIMNHLGYGHNHHHHPSSSRGGLKGDDNDKSSSPSGSPRHYYPQREERRANFIRSHQQEPKTQEGKSNEQKHSRGAYNGSGSGNYPSSSANIVATTVETHKKPPSESKAFTRHYFDSSKIQKGGGGSGPRCSLFPFNANNGHGSTNTKNNLNQSQSSSTKATSRPGTNTTAPVVGLPPHPSTSATTTNHNLCNGGGNNNAATFLTQTTNAQVVQPKQTLPAMAQVNVKLKQYQRQQRQKEQQEFSWRDIQRQSAASVSNPFEDDPDPPYYPAAAAISHHAQTHAYQSRASTKVSGNEFDVEPPKFNSLRRSASRSGQNSSVSSQINYSVTPTHYQHQPQQPWHFPHGIYASPPSAGHQHHHYSSPYNSLHHHSHRRQGNNEDINNLSGSGRGSRADDCPYCDQGGGPAPPLSLSVPALQQSDPHYMCHYGYGQQFLRRRNTWHHHKDQVEAITTSV